MRARGVLALTGCLVLVGLIGITVPPSDEFADHKNVAMGQWGSNDTYAANVVSVALARRAEPAPGLYGKPVEAPPGAVVVVVTLEHRAARAEARVASLARFVDGTGRTSKALIRGEFESRGPGFVSRGQLVFVVDANTVAGSRLVLPSRSQPFTQLVTDTIRVDLGLTTDTDIAAALSLAPSEVTAP